MQSNPKSSSSSKDPDQRNNVDKRAYMPHKGDQIDDPEELLQVQPLLGKSEKKESTDAGMSGNKAKFKVYNEEEESTKILELTMLEFSFFKAYVLVPILGICTGTFFWLFLYWYPKLRKTFFYNECCDITQATHLFVQGTLDHVEIVEIKNRNAEILDFLSDIEKHNFEQKPFLTFEYRFIKYQLDYASETFVPIVFETALPMQSIHTKYSGGIQGESDYHLHLIKYGKCNIDVPIKPIPQLLIEEVLNPFYLFQVFSMALWYTDGYAAYATCIFIISVTSAVTSLVETIKNLRNVRTMANYSCPVRVMRKGDENDLQLMESVELVPGDVIEIPDNMNMPCDIVVLTGSCIVNESMLTGESIPVIKNSLPYTQDIYNPDHDQKYTLYGGTKVIQTRKFGNSKVLGLVIRTAFTTMKGNLVRDILYPRPNKFKFYTDSLKFIGFMGIIALAGFLSTLPLMVKQGISTFGIVDRSLDLVTITVPPALPAAMTAGTAFAISRLRKRKIFCISPPRVNVSGRVNLMVFDKTGTLTEDGLQVFGYRGTENAIINHHQRTIFGSFQSDINPQPPAAHGNNSGSWKATQLTRSVLQKENDQMKFDESAEQTEDEKRNDLRVLFQESLASCHAITYVNGELIGDPLDVKMFQATGWQLEEDTQEQSDEIVLAYVRPPNYQSPAKRKERQDSLRSMSDLSMSDKHGHTATGKHQYQVALIRRFDFSSKLQRMSVIVKCFHSAHESIFRSYVKGSPERIRELCLSETIPSNFDEILQIYTECGYRVLALATKPLQTNYLKAQKLARNEVESDLQFLGFLIMQNKLKPVTVSVIQTLNQANIRTIMATGDNVLTAISVGRECNIIEGDAEVFLGDVRQDPQTGLDQVYWKSTKSDQHKLQPKTLVPDSQFFQDETRKPGYNTLIKLELEHSREEDEDSVNDIVSLEDFPWQHPPEQYAIAITGKAFNMLLQDPSQQAIVKQVLLKAQIYARMSPEDKAKLVEKLQDFCKTEVGMCGDGANDCGALKQADVGLSLSEAEASIAAPFTSQIQDISAVVILLREGRCALTTSFQCFKFIELYSMIQFVTVTMLYSIGSNLSDFQFLYIDLFILIPLSIFMGSTDAYKHLTPHLPSGSLLSLPVLASVFGSVFIQTMFQVFMFFYIRWWAFYEPLVPDPENYENNYKCYENTALVQLTIFQYLVVCMVFSISKPFRQPLYTNVWFTVSLFVLLVFNTYLILSGDAFATGLVDLESDLSMTYRLSVLLIVAVNSVMSYGFEKIVIWYLSVWWKSRKEHRKLMIQQQEIQEQQIELNKRQISAKEEREAARIGLKNARKSSSRFRKRLSPEEVKSNPEMSPSHESFMKHPSLYNSHR